MRLKTSSCSKTVIRKDLTRFVPLWGLYLIGGLMIMLTMFNSDRSWVFPKSLADTTEGFSAINLIYAALVAQLVFGDLFNARLCYAQHAMPMRREGWFLSHVISGLLFSLLPHLVVLPILLIFCGEFWFVALYWMLWMLLNFLFFYSVAVFSVFCTGNRFAMLAVYFMINFGSWILWMLAETLYVPMLKGVVLQEDPFMFFSPVTYMMNGSQEYICFDRIYSEYYTSNSLVYQGLGYSWGYLCAVAGIGVVLLGLALLMYRRRNLETAGDFVAVKPLKPVFSVVLTIGAGCISYLIGDLFSGMGTAIVFMAVGLAVGYFASQMMLHRTVRVFNRRSFVWLLIFALVFGGSLGMTALDIFGVADWVPEVSQVEYAEVAVDGSIRPYSDRYLKLTETADIETLTEAHSLAIQESVSDRYDYRTRTYDIRYYMNNGRTVERRYEVDEEGNAHALFSRLYSNSKTLLGYNDWDSYLETVKDVSIQGISVLKTVDRESMHELLGRIRKDIELENLGPNTYTDSSEYYAMISITTVNGSENRYRNFEVFTCAKNTVEWIQMNRHKFGLEI